MVVHQEIFQRIHQKNRQNDVMAVCDIFVCMWSSFLKLRIIILASLAAAFLAFFSRSASCCWSWAASRLWEFCASRRIASSRRNSSWRAAVAATIAASFASFASTSCCARRLASPKPWYTMYTHTHMCIHMCTYATYVCTVNSGLVNPLPPATPDGPEGPEDLQ